MDQERRTDTTLSGLLWVQAIKLFDCLVEESQHDEDRFNSLLEFFKQTASPVTARNERFQAEWLDAVKLKPEAGEYLEPFLRRRQHAKYGAIVRALYRENIWSREQNEFLQGRI